MSALALIAVALGITAGATPLARQTLRADVRRQRIVKIDSWAAALRRVALAARQCQVETLRLAAATRALADEIRKAGS